MKKRTMQEWANFLGCYVVKDHHHEIWAHCEKPILGKDGFWRSNGYSFDNFRLDFYNDKTGCWDKDNKLVLADVIADADSHDRLVLVEPDENNYSAQGETSDEVVAEYQGG